MEKNEIREATEILFLHDDPLDVEDVTRVDAVLARSGAYPEFGRLQVRKDKIDCGRIGKDVGREGCAAVVKAVKNVTGIVKDTCRGMSCVSLTSRY